jgi:hypothetical protein
MLEQLTFRGITELLLAVPSKLAQTLLSGLKLAVLDQ